MLVMVALPVQASARAPGPKYSMMRFVPPLVVRMPASLRITSLGAVQPLSSPVSRTPMMRGCSVSHGRSTITSTASGPPRDRQHPRPPALGVGIGADDESSRKRVVLQDDLVNDPGAWRPEADAVSCTDRFEEGVHLVVLEQGRLKVSVGAHVRPNQMVAMHRRRYGDRVAPGEHELQQGHLGGRVLHRHAVRANPQVAFQRRQVLGGRVVQVAEEQLFSQRERAVESFTGRWQGVRVHARTNQRPAWGSTRSPSQGSPLGACPAGSGGGSDPILTQLSRIWRATREQGPHSS